MYWLRILVVAGLCMGGTKLFYRREIFLGERSAAARPVRWTGIGVVPWYLYYRNSSLSLCARTNSSLSLCARTATAPLLLPFPPPRRLRRRPKLVCLMLFGRLRRPYFFSPPPAARFFFFVPGDPPPPRPPPYLWFHVFRKKNSLCSRHCFMS